jgi:hypothetical protein
VQTAARPGAGFFNGTGFEELMDDPAFQNFFGRSAQRDVTVSSSPETFTVMPLPTEGRPDDFTGAVGNFSVSSDVSQEKAGEGDPITLRMHVSGEGDFGRVTSPMLRDGDGWKAYTPTAKFVPGDSIGYRGEKVFEQPLVSTQPGTRTLPEVHFSWFDPGTRRYQEAHTSPLTVQITPAPGGSSVAGAAPPSGTGPALAGNPRGIAWRPDHPDDGGGRVGSLMPRYFQPAFLAVPPLVVIALCTGWLWMRREERSLEPARVAPTLEPESLAGELDRHAAANDARSFFDTARMAMRQALAAKWALAPAAVTTEEVAARFGADNDIARAFMLADEAAYSSLQLTRKDFMQWRQVVLRVLGVAS